MEKTLRAAEMQAIGPHLADNPDASRAGWLMMAFLAAAAGEPSGEVRSREVVPGVLGGRSSGVPVFSQRMPYPGPFSEHEITLGRPDEILRVTVTDFSSSVYLEGIFRAVRGLGALPPGTLARRLGDLPASEPR